MRDLQVKKNATVEHQSLDYKKRKTIVNIHIYENMYVIQITDIFIFVVVFSNQCRHDIRYSRPFFSMWSKYVAKLDEKKKI